MPSKAMSLRRLGLDLAAWLVYGSHMTDNIWTVVYMDGEDKTEERVYADAWQVSASGDLAFLNDPYEVRPFFVRAFAAGVWKTVRLHA